MKSLSLHNSVKKGFKIFLHAVIAFHEVPLPPPPPLVFHHATSQKIPPLHDIIIEQPPKWSSTHNQFLGYV